MTDQLPTWLTAWLLPLSLTLALFAGYLIFRNRKQYREIDRMLDAVLTRQPIKRSDLQGKPNESKNIYCWKSNRQSRKKNR